MLSGSRHYHFWCIWRDCLILSLLVLSHSIACSGFASHRVETRFLPLAAASNSSSSLNDLSHVKSEEVTRPPPSSVPSGNPVRRRPRLPILEYQSDWVCINKPAGMTVHGKQHTRRGPKPSPNPAVTAALKRQLSRKVFPVHRLDHRTSGALLLAFNGHTAAALHSSLRHGSAKKVYVALVRGHWNVRFSQSRRLLLPEHVTPEFSNPEQLVPDRVVVHKPLCVDGDLKQARTVFRLLSTGNLLQPVHKTGTTTTTIGSSCSQESLVLPSSSTTSSTPCSIVMVEPQTGRTHQIRRHSYYMGMPILGDTQHGDTKVNHWCRHFVGLDRLALHCLALDIPYPTEQTKAITKTLDRKENGEMLFVDGIATMEDAYRMPNLDGVVDENRRTRIIAPLPSELLHVLTQDTEMWRRAVEKEPQLTTEFYDFRGGTLGVTKPWRQVQ